MNGLKIATDEEVQGIFSNPNTKFDNTGPPVKLSDVMNKATAEGHFRANRLNQSMCKLDGYQAYRRGEVDLTYYWVGAKGESDIHAMMGMTAITEASDNREEAERWKEVLLADYPTARVFEGNWLK